MQVQCYNKIILHRGCSTEAGAATFVDQHMLQEIFNQRETIALASFFLSFSYLFILFVSILVCGQFSADYAFLMDASGSILPPEFDILKQFVKQVIDFLQIGQEKTHVGVIEYSRGASLQLNFTRSFNKTEIKKLVDDVPHTAGITRIDLALKIASEELFTAQGGMRDDSRKVLKLYLYRVSQKFVPLIS